MHQDQRSEPRYFVVTPLPAEISGLNADIIDISLAGARVQVTERLRAGQHFKFLLKTREASVEAPAYLIWCEVAAVSLSDEEPDRYFAGIAFEQPVATLGSVINDLVSTRTAIPIQESRSDDRYRVIAPLTASFADHNQLRVLDVSIRGARVSTPTLLTPGTSGRLRFTISGTDTHVWLPATVMWSRSAQRKGRYEAGLRISDAEQWLKTVIDDLAFRDGVAIETDSLQRKFDPFASRPLTGALGLRR